MLIQNTNLSLQTDKIYRKKTKPCMLTNMSLLHNTQPELYSTKPWMLMPSKQKQIFTLLPLSSLQSDESDDVIVYCKIQILHVIVHIDMNLPSWYKLCTANKGPDPCIVLYIFLNVAPYHPLDYITIQDTECYYKEIKKQLEWYYMSRNTWLLKQLWHSNSIS